MDYWLDTYYKPNRFFLSTVGLWPYQTLLEKRFLFFISCFFIFTQGYLQIGGLIMAWCNPDIFMESLPPVTVDALCYIKLFNFVYQTDKIKKLLTTLENDWKASISNDETMILREFATACRKKTLMYAGATYGAMIPFMLAPIVPIIKDLLPIDMTSDLNATIERPLMFHVEYLVDVETWYYYLLLHSYIATLFYITVVVGIDTMYLVYVQHACSLLGVIRFFKKVPTFEFDSQNFNENVLKKKMYVCCLVPSQMPFEIYKIYRLEHLVDKLDIDVDVHSPIYEDKPYHKLIQCIYQHNLAIEYIEMIESANALAVFFQVGINVICISFTGFQAVMKQDNPDESVKYVSFLLTQISLVFFASYPSQCLITESVRLFENISESTWYLTSIRTRKLLNFMILRCAHPCHLTAGRFYVLNMEYFSKVIRASMSYLTMLCSFQ